MRVRGPFKEMILAVWGALARGEAPLSRRLFEHFRRQMAGGGGGKERGCEGGGIHCGIRAEGIEAVLERSSLRDWRNLWVTWKVIQFLY